MSDSVPETIEAGWEGFYKLSGIATLVVMTLFLTDVVIWVILGPYPSSAKEWFSLLTENRLVGLALLSIPTLFGMTLYFLTFLGLYRLLRKVHPAYAAVAVLFAFVGLATVVVTHMAYPMLHLSDQYSASTTEMQRSLMMAAGEAQIASTVAGTKLGGLLLEGAAVVFSLLMLKSRVFGKVTAYLGIVGHGLDFIRIVTALALLPEGAGAFLLVIGGGPQLLWQMLVGRELYQLGQRWSGGEE